MRHLILVLGDQLDANSSAFEGFDPAQDRILMVEARGEGERVWSHRARTVLFLSAMRHFADELRARAWPLTYHTLDDAPQGGLVEVIAHHLRDCSPEALVLVEPGEYWLEAALSELSATAGARLELRLDTHFIVSRADFLRWAKGYKQLRMEFFYRHVRKQTGVLMDGDEPEDGAWNYDAENRASFGKKGPGLVPAHAGFEPDAITWQVMDAVQRHFPSNPGALDEFDWPVTREQALAALRDFIDHRLELFGRYQDAMWTAQPFLYHARISAALNLKLLNPREVADAAVTAWREGRVGLASVEGFVRQIIGWREFIRGVYWLEMPGLAAANHFGHARDLPRWFWTGETHMACQREAVTQTLRHGYAHHIQRLMVTGLFGLLAEIDPRQVAHWYLAVYVDAVEWVELPNVAGMALYANGGRFTSKPYAASGAYINRMSNYCAGCRYDPAKKTGDDACPLTTLYWSFLDRHEAELGGSPRTALMVKNLQRLSAEERAAVRVRSEELLGRLDGV
jgi:deoxyribodipyrimidine photolyase-related protein